MRRILSIITLALCLGAAAPQAMAGVSRQGGATQVAAIARPGVDAPVASARPGASAVELTVSGAAESAVRFYIYSITGQMVKAVDVAPGQSLTVEVPQGYYIVKCADFSRQIVVR